MIIDATGAPLGRISSAIAKLAREGEEIIVINAEKAIFKKDKNLVIKKLVEKKNKGSNNKGPFISFKSTEIFKRSVRGMIGRKKAIGREAFKRIKIYEGIPAGLDVSQSINLFRSPDYNKYPSIKEISKYLGYE